jgi:hypothetical protein
MGVRITDGGLSWTASIDDAELNRKANQIENRIGKMSSNAVGEVGKMDGSFNKLAYTLGGAFSIAAAAGFVKELTNVRGQFQQIEIAFTTMLKSKEKADQLMKEAIQLAAQTPFSLQDVAKGAKQLIAYGFEAKNITENLSKLGNIAAGVSAPLGDIVYLYGTLKTQGRAYTRDILQFTARGIPIIGELAKQFGVTESQVQKLVEAGKVGFPDIEKAFNNMTGAGGIFFNLMQEQSKSLTGQISNLGDAWDVMLNKIGKDNQGVLSGGIGIAADLVLNYEKVIDILGILITSYGVYKAAVIATAAFEKVSAASKFGVVVALNEESVARAVNSASLAEELRITVSNLAVKKAAATESAVLAAADLASARERLVVAELAQVKSLQSVVSSARVTAAKEVEIATNEVVAAQEKAGLTRKAALSASSEFYTAKTGLESAAKGANAAITVELTAAESLNAAGKLVLATAQAAYNTVLAASPMLAFTAVVTALGLVIYSLTQITNAAEESQKKLNEAKDEGIKTADKEQNSIEQLIGVIKSQTASVEQKKKAYDDLQKSTNGVLLAYSQEEIASGKATKSIDDYIIKIREATSARKAFSEYKELADQIDELDRKGVKAISTFKRVGYSLKNTFAPSGVGLKEYFQGLVSTDAANSTIVRQQKDSATKQMEALKKVYGDKFNEIITGIDDKSKNNPIKIRTVSVIDEEIKNKKEAQDATSFKKEYATIQSEINKLEAEKTAITGKLNKTEQKQSNERLAALKEINQAEQEAKTKSLSKDQAEIKSAKDKYDVLRAEAKKAGLGSGSITRIDNIEKKVTGNIRYDQETEKLKASLDSQRKIYDDFENYKKEVGETKARERYSKELEIAKQTEDKAAKELAGLMTISAVGGSLSGNQQERLKVITDSYKKQYDIDQALKDKNFADALNASKTHTQKLLDIEKEYQRNVKALGDTASTEQLAVLKQVRDEKIATENSGNLETELNWANMFASFEFMTKDSVSKWIEASKVKVEQSYKDGEITVLQYQQHMKELNDASDQFTSNSLSSFSKVADAYKKYQDARASGDSSKEFKNLAGAAGAAASDVQGVFDSVVGGLNELGIGTDKYTQATVKNVSGILGGVADLGKGLASGNPVDIVKGSVAILTNAIELFNFKDKKLERKIDAYKADLASLQDSYEKLDRAVQNSVGESIYADQAAQIENLKKQEQDLIGARNAEQSKKKTDAGKVAEYNKQISDIPNKIDDINKAIAANLIQGSFKDLSNSLADALTGAFQAGEDGIDAMDKSLNSFIGNAIKNSLKLKLIEPIVKSLTDDLVAYAKGNGNSIVGFDFTSYKEDLKTAGTTFTDALNANKDFFLNTADGADAPKSNLQGSIKRELTEQTGSELAGLYRASYDLSKQELAVLIGVKDISSNQLLIASKSLTALEAIQANTLDTVNKLDEAVVELKNIVVNTKPGQTGRALGI